MKMNDYITKTSIDEVAHSSGIAKAQSGVNFGASSGVSFSRRQKIMLQNNIIKGYAQSELAYRRNTLSKVTTRKSLKTGVKHNENSDMIGNRQANKLNENQIDRATKARMRNARFDTISQSGLGGMTPSSGAQVQRSVSNFYNFKPKIGG